MSTTQTDISWRYWALLASGLLAIKLLSYLADPDIEFFLGDSATYLSTALSSYIPPDRSYLYGFFIRLASLGGHPLNALIIIQELLGVYSCLLLAYLLLRFFGCSLLVAALAALCFAVEPSELLFERYMMAESVSLFLFALFITTLMLYLRDGELRMLLLMVTLGAGAIAMRTAYLPAIVVTGMVAVGWNALHGSQHLRSGGGALRRLAHPLLFLAALVALLALHGLPRSHSNSGLFLLAAWSPALDSELLASDPILQQISAGLQCDLQDEHQRVHELFLKGCLIDRIQQRFPDPVEANAFAQRIAMQALLRRPLQVGELGLHTWLEFWDPLKLGQILRYDTGADPIPEDFTALVRTHYAMDISGWNRRMTPTKDYFEHATWWHLWVVASPLIMLLWWLLTRRRYGPNSLIIAIASWVLLLVVTVPVVISSVRFFHGIAWLSFFPLATSLDCLGRAAKGWLQQRRPAMAG